MAHRSPSRIAARRGRPGAVAAILLVVPVSCGDVPSAPNTDVGLRVWAEVTPSVVSLRDSLTTITVRVQVLNPSWAAVRVPSGGPPYRFTADPAQSSGVWGSARIACDSSPFLCGPPVDWWGDSVYRFEPRRRGYNEHEFSMAYWLAHWTLVPGQYRVRSWFNGREGESATLTITP